MKVYFDRKVLIGFFLALGLLFFLGIYSYTNSRNSNATGEMVAQTNEVLYHIEKLHSIHLQIESQLMRYLVTADSIFRSDFMQKIDEARDHYVLLSKMVSDNQDQRHRLDSIGLLGRTKVDMINRVITSRLESLDNAQEIALSKPSLDLTNKINDIVARMQNEEKRLLDNRIREYQEDVAKFNATFLTLVIGSGLIIVVLFITINSTLRARLQAEDALQKTALQVQDLYNNAPCGYHSLNKDGLIVEMNQTWLDWLGLTREEVVNKKMLTDFMTPQSQHEFETKFNLLKSQGIVNTMEFEVEGVDNKPLYLFLNASGVYDEDGNFLRTRSTIFNITERHEAEAKVVEVNRELEAFSYSVSHDLRAPLRSINGYSKILEEDYSGQLDQEGNRILQVIRKNALRMGQLIDDLLNFSRLGRKELEKTMLNMNSLVENVQQELMINENGRQVEFDVKPLPEAYGDLSMIRQVWINLISNALKYSKRQDVSKIEIGSIREEENTVFYIRDNGVGFDMAYADKLFGVFQRLHRIEEFDGTGVGLALVHRIVSRHGGKIWANAEVNHGATFFFSIPVQTPM